MTSTLAALTFDCAEPTVVAEFWAAATGQQVDDGASPFFASIGRGADGPGPTWMFAKVDEAKSAKNRLHIDLETTDMAAEVTRLVELGATEVAAKNEWGHTWTVMADPEGNEFCVSGPHL